jgi:hypothetical protein
LIAETNRKLPRWVSCLLIVSWNERVIDGIWAQFHSGRVSSTSGPPALAQNSRKSRGRALPATPATPARARPADPPLSGRHQPVTRRASYFCNVLGPVPGVDVMAKRSQGWVKCKMCEDRLPYYRGSSCSLPLLRPHDHNPTTREDLAAGAWAKTCETCET